MLQGGAGGRNGQLRHLAGGERGTAHLRRQHTDDFRVHRAFPLWMDSGQWLSDEGRQPSGERSLRRVLLVEYRPTGKDTPRARQRTRLRCGSETVSGGSTSDLPLVDQPAPRTIALASRHLSRGPTVVEPGTGQCNVAVDHRRLLVAQAELWAARQNRGVLRTDGIMAGDVPAVRPIHDGVFLEQGDDALQVASGGALDEQASQVVWFLRWFVNHIARFITSTGSEPAG